MILLKSDLAALPKNWCMDENFNNLNFEDPQTIEFDFLRSDTKASQGSLELPPPLYISPSKTNNSDLNNSISFLTDSLSTPLHQSDPWNYPPHLVHNTLSSSPAGETSPNTLAAIDEPQLFSPDRKTPNSTGSSLNSPPGSDPARFLFETNDESEVIDIGEFNTPPISFEDDFIKYSKVVEAQEKELIAQYEANKKTFDVDTTTDNMFPDYFVHSQSTLPLDESDEPAVRLGKIEDDEHDERGVYEETAKDQKQQQRADEDEDQIKNTTRIEHNYTLNIANVAEHNRLCNKAANQNSVNQFVVTEQQRIAAVAAAKKDERRLPKLRLKLPPKVEVKMENDDVMGTPEIANEILDLENQFDLISYINSTDATFEILEVPEQAFVINEIDIKPSPTTSPAATSTAAPTVTSPAPATSSTPLRPVKRRASRLSIEDPNTTTSTISDQPRPKRSRPSRSTRASSPCTSVTSEYLNPGSCQSFASDDSANTKATKRRGRPPKPVEALIDPQELANLSPEDYRYRELRNKNNEASRRSRMNRKDRENALEREMRELERHYSKLETEEQKLISECSKWRDAVMQLALL